MYVELYSQPDQIKAVSSLYLQQTLDNLKGKVNKTYTPRIVIYSSHDTTIGMILAALNMTNLECITDHYLKDIKNEDTCVSKYPTYTSNVIFQLWEKNNQHYIKVLYNGVPRKIPICEYNYQCSLEEFEKWVNEFSVPDYFAACGIQQEHKSYYIAIFILAALVLVLILTILYMKRKELRRNYGYESVYDSDIQKLYSTKVYVDIKTTDKEKAFVKIRKESEGNNRLTANKDAEAIEYQFNLNNENLLLNGYFLSNFKNKFKEQSVDITIYLPINTKHI